MARRKKKSLAVLFELTISVGLDRAVRKIYIYICLCFLLSDSVKDGNRLIIRGKVRYVFCCLSFMNS